MGLDKYYSSNEYTLGDKYSEKEYMQLFQSRINKCQEQLTDYLFMDSGHGFIHNKETDLTAIKHKNMNTKLLFSKNVLNDIIFNELTSNAEEVIEWALYDKNNNYELKIPCAINCGIGINNHNNNVYVTKDLTVILSHDFHKELGFGIKTYYPDIRKDAELYEPNKFIGVSVGDLTNYFELNNDDIAQLTGGLTSFKDDDIILYNEEEFVESMTYMDTIDCKINKHETSLETIEKQLKEINICNNKDLTQSL